MDSLKPQLILVDYYQSGCNSLTRNVLRKIGLEKPWPDAKKNSKHPQGRCLTVRQTRRSYIQRKPISNLAVNLHTTKFNIQKLYFLITNGDYTPSQH
jgi:hypothetical protein